MPRRLLFILTALALTVLGAAQTRDANALKAATFVPPKRWALVIGASDYKEFGKLTYAAADAKSFAKTLTERFRFEPETLELITDDPDSPKKPNAATIAAALDRQIADKRLEKGDLFIFYFAGHGVGTPNGDLLLPTDATPANVAEVGLPVKDILDRFVKAGLKNVLIIADACRAGEKNEFGAELEELGRKANIGVILGCAPGSRSYEYPQLGHGVFTHFLMKALKDKELCSPISGALWTSRVGESVQKQVHDYTIRDYPTAPQTPLAASEKSQDVLLGSFISAVNAPDAVKAFQKEVTDLAPEKRLAAFSTFANDLFGQERYAESAEVLKTVEGLDHLSPLTRYLFGTCLTILGRHNEAERQFAELAKQDESPLMKALAVTFAPSRKITPAQRLKAAREAWNIEPAEWVGLIVWTSAQLYAPKSEINKIIDTLTAAEDLSPRWRNFLTGYQALNSGDANTAMTRFDEAVKTPGEMPSEELIETARLVALNYAGRFDEALSLLKKGAENPESDAKWCLVLAQRYKEEGKAEPMMAMVKTALTRKMDPEDLLFALRIVGTRYPEISADIVKRADEFPLAWMASVAKLCCTAQPTQAGVQDDLSRAVKYCDDQFAVIYEYLRVHDAQMDELVAQGRVTPSDYFEDQFFTATIMAGNVDEFGYTPEIWFLFSKASLFIGQCEQTKALFELYLGEAADKGTLDPMLRVPFLVAAECVGDDKRVDQLWKMQDLPQNEVADRAWAYAIYLAMRGRVAEAEAAIPSRLPSPVYRAAATAFRAYLDAFHGKSVNLDALVAPSKNDPVALQLVALAYAAQGNWPKAEPLLKEACTQRSPPFTVVYAKAAQVYFDRLIATKRYDEADDFTYETMTSGYGNPLYRKLHYGPTPTLASYAGTIKLSIIAIDVPPEFLKGQMELKVAAGAVTVTGTIAGRALTGKGTVDAYGNITLAVKADDKAWTLTGKIAPPAKYKTIQKLTTLGQTFLLMEPNGQAVMFICAPVRA